MCNLYSQTTNIEAIRRLFAAFRHDGMNLPYQPTIYPDYDAAIIRNEEGGARLTTARWGMPAPNFIQIKATKARAEKLRKKGKEVDFAELLKMEPDGGTTNIRKTDSSHWTRWLGVEHRCLVPFNAFAEPDTKGNAWFALDESRPLAFFAGAWVPQWTSVRKVKNGLETIDVFGFLTTDANDVVKPIHWKAMPVILTEPAEAEAWMTRPWEEVASLQTRVFPNDRIQVLAREVPKGTETAAGGPLAEPAAAL